MPFSKARDALPQIQHRVGLYEPNCQAPRLGDRTRAGAHGFNLISCNSHMQPLTEQHAQCLWDMIPQNEKDNPASLADAQAISMLAQNAVQSTPRGCAKLLPNWQAKQEAVTYYHTLGSPIFKTCLHAYHFILFLNTNMDVGHTVKWCDLTGREQYEWYDAFEACGYTYLRSKPQTQGLCGTNPGRFENVNQLTTALLRSPTLAGRRPAGHTVAADVWEDTLNTVRRELNFH